MRDREVAAMPASRIEKPHAGDGSQPGRGLAGWALAEDKERRETYKILVVEDDVLCLQLLQLELDSAGYEVWPAVDGREALAYLKSHGLPHVAILDYFLPGMTGPEIASKLLKICDVPIMVTSARSDTETVLKAFEKQAEDFVAKPFEYPVLLARLKRLLKRVGSHSHAARSRVRIDDWLEVDLSRRLARAGGESICLSPTENKLFHLLLRDAGTTLSSSYINQRLWPQADSFDEGSLRTLVYRLRSKVEQDPKNPIYISTHRGSGYRFGASTADV